MKHLLKQVNTLEKENTKENFLDVLNSLAEIYNEKNIFKIIRYIFTILKAFKKLLAIIVVYSTKNDLTPKT